MKLSIVRNNIFIVFLGITVIKCLSFQQGNPSFTVFRNHGDVGIYGKFASPKYQFKLGESCIRSYFGLLSFGDASAELAQQKANLTEVVSLDHSVKTQYFFLQEFCTIVYGK
jgi:hypothetical protein